MKTMKRMSVILLAVLLLVSAAVVMWAFAAPDKATAEEGGTKDCCAANDDVNKESNDNYVEEGQASAVDEVNVELEQCVGQCRQIVSPGQVCEANKCNKPYINCRPIGMPNYCQPWP